MVRAMLACLVVVTTGCWTPRERVDMVAWANDDSEVGGMLIRYEERQAVTIMGNTESRDFHFQLFAYAPDGSSRRQLSAEFPGQAGPFYFMKTAGYVLFSVVDTTSITWRQLLLADGTVRGVGTQSATNDGRVDCSSVDLVPSPDGSRVARIAREAACNAAQMRVGFLDAASLAPVAAEHALTLQGFPDWTWTPAGDFIIVQQEEPRAAWKLVPGEPPLGVPVPTCTWPKTSSSQVSSDGRLATAVDDRVESGPAGAETPFGCGT